ncbi:MAG: LacI family transcriptional regulator [Actinomycetota bacterium]|nr:LacI family transcriptional regulator [Actinomycetota bacterium]
MAVTIRDVGARAGVSQATAARALGGYGHVSALVRTRVQHAARELGYVPNSVARALASGITHAVGLVVGDIENPFFSAVARGMSNVLEESGHTLLLANSDEDPDRERIAIEALRERQVDSLVVVPSSAGASAHLRAAAASSPLVLLDRTIPGLRVDSVTVDNRGGARGAVEHLIGHGHRRIGLVSDEPDISTSAERLAGYRAALAAAGIVADEHLISLGGPTPDEGYRAARRVLETPERPTAIFTTNNFMTLGAMRAIRDLGLGVPYDVSLVGFDDLEWTTLVDPPLTVVAQPATELGEAAARRVLSRLAGADGRPRRVRLGTKLIVRASCASLG